MEPFSPYSFNLKCNFLIVNSYFHILFISWNMCCHILPRNLCNWIFFLVITFATCFGNVIMLWFKTRNAITDFAQVIRFDKKSKSSFATFHVWTEFIRILIKASLKLFEFDEIRTFTNTRILLSDSSNSNQNVPQFVPIAFGMPI